MASSKYSSGMTKGLILIGLGIIFLLDEFRIIDFGEFISTFWPVILIGIGIRLIMARNRSSTEPSSETPETSSTSDSLSKSKLFGDISMKSGSQSFSGGNAATLFGDIDVDLTGIDLQDGEKIMTINNMFGDVKIRVPANVKWAARSNTILGDIKILEDTDSGFLAKRTYHSSGYETATKKLYFSVSQIIGDLRVEEVKSRTAATKPTTKAPARKAAAKKKTPVSRKKPAAK